MNFFYRWRLLKRIVNAIALQYGAESADAIGRFKGINGGAWVAFAKELQHQKLGDDFDLAIGLLWFAVNAPNRDRVGFELKRVCYSTYCGVSNQLLFSEAKGWKENLATKRTFDSALREVKLPVDYELSDAG